MDRAATTVHFICGPVGAGKTTYALKLCEAHGAVHFSIDEWMVTLFSADTPPMPDWNWVVERVGRSEAQIVAMAIRLGRLNVPSVLDLGFLGRDQRDRVARVVTGAGLVPRLHVLDIDPGERWRRVEARNAQRGETYRLAVTRPMFDFIEQLWQRPSPEEMAALDGRMLAA